MPPTPPKRKRRSRNWANLRGALVAKMQSEGPVAAVNFCHDEAPLIAAQVAERLLVVIGRTAVRHRSPSNAPGEWQQAALAEFAAKVTEGNPATGMTSSSTVDVNGQNHFRFAQSIPTEAPCLACHGDSVAPPIKAEIDKHYPNDNATGFKQGDLRGMFWVEFPMTPAATPVSQNPPDQRAPIIMSEAQRVSLRLEMRGRMEILQGVTAALASGDWPEVAKRAEEGTPWAASRSRFPLGIAAGMVWHGAAHARRVRRDPARGRGPEAHRRRPATSGQGRSVLHVLSCHLPPRDAQREHCRAAMTLNHANPREFRDSRYAPLRSTITQRNPSWPYSAEMMAEGFKRVQIAALSHVYIRLLARRLADH